MQDFKFILPYFPSISDFFKILNHIFHTEILIDKKTIHRFNRCYISDHQGMKLLSIPLKKISNKKNYFDVVIDNSASWKNIHFNALKSAYGKTPYFSFYEKKLKNVYDKKHHTLFEVNLDAFLFINESLQLNFPASVPLVYNYKPAIYINHFGVNITEPTEISILEFLFRFGPAGIFELLI